MRRDEAESMLGEDTPWPQGSQGLWEMDHFLMHSDPGLRVGTRVTLVGGQDQALASHPSEKHICWSVAQGWPLSSTLLR